MDVSKPTSISPTDGDSTLKLGARGDDGAHTFDGVMDEIAIWNRALSSEEISDLKEEGIETETIPWFNDNEN